MNKIIKEITDKVFGNMVYDAETAIIKEIKAAASNAVLLQIKISEARSRLEYTIANILREYLKRKNYYPLKINGNSLTDKDYKDWTYINYHGTPIFIIGPHKEYTKNVYNSNHTRPNNRMPYNLNGVCGESEYLPSVYKIATINTYVNKENFHRFVKVLVKKALKKISQIEQSQYIEMTRQSGEYLSIKKRTMDTVFIDKEIKKTLQDAISNFVNKRDWYEKNSIPYHYGILLYGPPGTGKSTIIRSLITEYSAEYGLQNMERPLLLGSPVDLLMTGNDTCINPQYPQIVIIEDIDASILSKRKKKDKEELTEEDYYPKFRPYPSNDTSLSDILNRLDGLTNLENVIYVFTTNHIENIDPALIRPGRIDLSIHIDLPGREAYNQFCNKYFGKSIPEDFQIKSNPLIAELQSEVVGGKTFEDILEILGKEDE